MFQILLSIWEPFIFLNLDLWKELVKLKLLGTDCPAISQIEEREKYRGISIPSFPPAFGEDR